jgi:hypothetical protein
VKAGGQNGSNSGPNAWGHQRFSTFMSIFNTQSKHGISLVLIGKKKAKIIPVLN